MSVPSRKTAIAAAFSRAAAGYDDHAVIQHQAVALLAARIVALKLPPALHLLEIGCGTGLLTQALHRSLPRAHRLITDLAPAMVQSCRARHTRTDDLYCAMDGETPCVTGARFDLICASLAFQWFDDLPRALPRLHALLHPSGWLAFTTLGPATLLEWRACLSAERLAPPTPDFADPALLTQAWPAPTHPATFDRTLIQVVHSSGRAFLASLRAIGANTPRPRYTPLRPTELRRVLARFEREHAATASYEIVTACLQR
jgi:malonyl-CoA O-methyltransferase